MFEWLDTEHRIRLFGVVFGFLLLISIGSAACVGHWSLNNTAGLIDDCSFTYNMTNNGATSGATGIFNEAYDFESGDPDYTEDGDLDLTSDMTICAWVKLESQAAVNIVIDKRVTSANDYQTNYQLYVLSGASEGKVRFLVGGCGTTWFYATTNAAEVTTGEWAHLCGVFNDTANTLAIYVNGSSVAKTDTGTSTLTPCQQAGTTKLGRNFGAAPLLYDGIIDEVWVFDEVLPTTNISNLMDYNNLTGPAPASSWDYDVLSSTYSSPVYETTNTSFNFTISTNTTTISNVTAVMSWNSSNYSATSTGSNTVGDNKTSWFYYEDFNIPLVTTNYTNITEFWYYDIGWTNGTITSTADSSNTQSIFHYFYWGTYAPETVVIENTEFDMNATFTESVSGVVYNVTSIFNNTIYKLVGSGGVYYNTTTAPNVTAPSETFVSNATFYLNWTGTYGGQRLYNRTSGNSNIGVYSPALVNCTLAGSMPTLNFSFFTENNLTALPSDMDATFTWYVTPDHTGTEYEENFSISNALTIQLCVYPNTTLYVDSFQVYTDNGTSYRTRNYFLTNATLTNTTVSEISLYNIPTADSDLLTLTIVDDLVAQEGDYVVMERYYPGENLYRAVEIGMTDENGKTFLYPVPNDVYYRFLVIRDYDTVYSGAPREIGIDEFTIDTGEGLTLEYFDVQGIEVSCNRTGNIIGCSLVNPSGLAIGAQLLVREVGIYSDTEICFQEVTTVSTTTMQCNVSGYTRTIQADLMFIAPDSLLAAWSETFNNTPTNVFEGMGLFIAVLMVLGSALLLGYSPALSLVGALFGLAISVVIGIAALSITSVLLMIIAGVFIIVKVKS